MKCDAKKKKYSVFKHIIELNYMNKFNELGILYIYITGILRNIYYPKLISYFAISCGFLRNKKV